MLTQEHLKELLHYNPETGVFTWLIPLNNKRRVGEAAGSLTTDGYTEIGIKRVRYLAHRLAFLYMLGSFPNHEIDHINRVRNDNRWVNLRAATRQQNAHNVPVRKDNTSRYKGVHKVKNCHGWTAKCGIGGKVRYLGFFNTEEDAAKAYQDFAEQLQKHFAYHHSTPAAKIQGDYCNKECPRSTNTSGFRGVHYRVCMGKWQARCSIAGKRVSLGHFDSAEEASKVREAFVKRQKAELN